MMRKPLILPIVAWITLATVLSIPIQVMMIYGHGPTEVSAVSDKLTLLNWFVILVGLFTATLINRASSYTRIFAPLLVAIVFLNNWAVAAFATDYNATSALSGSLLFAALNVPLLHPRIRELFKNPQLRWWMRAERVCANIPVFLGGSRRDALRSETFDISESGAFVQAESQTINLELQETISLCLTIGTYSQIRCSGRVIRVVESKGTYPPGIGVEFVGMPAQQKREIRRFIARHRRNERGNAEVAFR